MPDLQWSVSTFQKVDLVGVGPKMINLLREKYPWPEVRPTENPAEWVLDGGGKELITERIRDGVSLILEVGVFLGSSVKTWLSANPNVHVVAIDPWEGEWWVRYAKKHGREELVEPFSRPEGPYLTFLSSLWEFRGRVHPIRGWSPDKLYELSELGLEPDLIYFDSDKSGDDLAIAHDLFPSAILSGDDWNWGIHDGYPIRSAVNGFAAKHGYTIHLNRTTWLLDHRAQSVVDYRRKIAVLLKDKARALKNFIIPSDSEVIH